MGDINPQTKLRFMEWAKGVLARSAGSFVGKLSASGTRGGIRAPATGLMPSIGYIVNDGTADLSFTTPAATWAVHSISGGTTNAASYTDADGTWSATQVLSSADPVATTAALINLTAIGGGGGGAPAGSGCGCQHEHTECYRTNPQTRATIHPMKVHPATMFRTMIAGACGCLRSNATRVGTK